MDGLNQTMRVLNKTFKELNTKSEQISCKKNKKDKYNKQVSIEISTNGRLSECQLPYPLDIGRL